MNEWIVGTLGRAIFFQQQRQENGPHEVVAVDFVLATECISDMNEVSSWYSFRSKTFHIISSIRSDENDQNDTNNDNVVVLVHNALSDEDFEDGISKCIIYI